MSGWDTSSRPSWGSQDGPEDNTQAFSDQPAGTEDPWSRPASSNGGGWGAHPQEEDQQPGGPGPGSADFERQDPGYPGPNLPRRGRHAGNGEDAYGRDDMLGRGAPGADGAPPWEIGAEGGAGMDGAPHMNGSPGVNGAPGGDGLPGWDSAPDRNAEPGWDGANGRGSVFGHDGMSGQGGAPGWGDSSLGRDGISGWDGGSAAGGPQGWDGEPAGNGVPGRDGAAGWGSPSARPPWEEDQGNADDMRPGPGGPDLGRRDAPRFDGGRPDDAQQDRGRLDRRGTDWDRQDAGRQDSGRQDSGRPGFTPREPGFTPRDPGLAPPGPGSAPRDFGPRMDPALQDFFAPAQHRGGNGANGASQGPRPNGGPAGRDLRGAPGRQLPPAPARGAQDQRGPARRVPASAQGDGGNARARLIGIGVFVLIVVTVGGYLLLHRSPSHATASGAGKTSSASPAGHAKSPKKAPKSKTKAKTKPAANTTVYTLSTPATAGGYPQGQDPNFLSTATSTAKLITDTVASEGAGKLSGFPVSASYRLPTGEQVITFVGYQGTFDPAKVMAAMKSLGSDEKAYPAGSHGGQLMCLTTLGTNTAADPTTEQGSICIWATTSTIGITEFFSVSGPEILTTHQYKGAQDTVSLRSGVEAAKSSLSVMPSPAGARKIS